MHALLLALPLLALSSAQPNTPRHHPGQRRADRYPHHVDRYRREVVNGVVIPLHNGSAAFGAVSDPVLPPTTSSTSDSQSQEASGSGAAAGGGLEVSGSTGTSAKSNHTSGGSGSGSSSGSGASNSTSTGSCFPNGGAKLPTGGAAPSVSPSQWWCPASKQTGFLGFSHALESSDCQDPTNQKATLVKTFAAMKADYGASMIRIYAPECRQESFWTGVLEAAAENNMAVIPQIWWGFENQDLWKQSASQLENIVATNKLAKYVFQSVAFGSEPIGDGVDGGYDQFVSDLKAFKAKMNAGGVKVAISEDWDRAGIMTQGSLDTLAQVGQDIKANTDLVQAHIMPYYHEDQVATAYDAWPYFEKYIKFLKTQVKKQILITESPWAYTTQTYHGRGANQAQTQTMSDFDYYWGTILGSQKSCEFFKANGVGYFTHTYSNEFEEGFGLLFDSGKPIMNFKPAKC